MKPQAIVTQCVWDMPALWTLNARIKGESKICSVKVYGTPCTTMHNLRGRKKRTKTSVCCSRANAKVTFHTITSLWVASDLSTFSFKLMTFRIKWEASIRSWIFPSIHGALHNPKGIPMYSYNPLVLVLNAVFSLSDCSIGIWPNPWAIWRLQK